MIVKVQRNRIKPGQGAKFILMSAFLLLCGLVLVSQSGSALAQTRSRTQATGLQKAPTQREGQHDFDFHIGTWKTHLRRLLNPLTGSTTWVEYDGTTVVRKVWNGRANLVELVADGLAGHFEGLSLRLYNLQSRQWSLNFANINSGTIAQPTIGEFKNGRGEFFDQETLNGRAIFVRFIISNITPNSCHFEQAFSDDGGKTWEVNWIATDTRMKDDGDQPSAARAPSQADSSQAKTENQISGTERNRQHDFDFNIGTWKTHVSRLLRPLTGSTNWVEYDGKSVVRKVWNGRASLFELHVDGPAGHIEGVGLRLYNPQSRQWSLNWANSHDGTMTKPMIGEFKNAHGEFFDQETFNGRAIFARNGFSDITTNSSRFEQAFSNDGGKTWETNWVMTFTRVKDDADRASSISGCTMRNENQMKDSHLHVFARFHAKAGGGTTFHFVKGIHAALELATDAANGKDVRLGRGVGTIRQYLEAGFIAEMHIAISPILLG
jgi:dihydrofolate reductase